MGYPTLVAYDRAGYDLHHARGGVDPDDVTPETPFGGRPDGSGTGAAPGGVAGVGTDGGGPVDDRRTAIEPDPVATGLTFPAVCSFVDPIEHDALLVVDDDFAVRTYLVVALPSTETDGSDEDAGGPGRATAAIVGYDDPADAAYLRGWLAGARTVSGRPRGERRRPGPGAAVAGPRPRDAAVAGRPRDGSRWRRGPRPVPPRPTARGRAGSLSDPGDAAGRRKLPH